MSNKQEKPKDINEYVNFASSDAKDRLNEILECLRIAAPEAEEGLKWGSPAFTQKRVLFTVAAYKDHLSFYPTPAVLEVFKEDLDGFKTTSGGIQFPLDKPLPLSLIDKIARYRLREVLEKDAKWM